MHKKEIKNLRLYPKSFYQMGDTATGLLFLAAAAGGAWYLNQSSAKLAKVDKRPVPGVMQRAINASESQIDANNVKEVASPALEGRFGGSRMVERVISTRLAQSWRNADVPYLANLRSSNAPIDEMLVRVQTTARNALAESQMKTHYFFDPMREKPVTQGSIRKRFQIPNFK